jgi:hypothetical protein
LLHANALGHRNQPRGWGKRVRCVGTSHECDSLSDSNRFYIRPNCFHDSNSLASEVCWQVSFADAGTSIESLPGEFATPLLNIEKVNAGSFHAHQRLSWTGDGDRRRHFF